MTNAMRHGAFACAICAVVFALYATQTPERTPQSGFNLRFVQAPTFGEALERYRPTRPPTYPLLARALGGIGVSLGSMNLLCLLGLLAWTWGFARRNAPTANAMAPVALMALLHTSYPVAATPTAELLFTLLAALTLQALAAQLRSPGRRGWWAVTAGAAAAAATRYFGLFWLHPLIGVRLALQREVPVPRRLVRAAAALVLATLPAALWMAHALRTTGFVSGIDRFAVREGVHRSELRGLDNALLTLMQYGKTLYVDAFSTSTWATHEAIDGAYPTNALEGIGLGLGLAALAAAAAFLLRRGPSVRERGVAWLLAPSEVGLVAQASLLFALSTLALWIAGNNDRLYGRFLYPSYPFLVLGVFALYWRLRALDAPRAIRLPFLLLYPTVIGIQLLRIL